MVKVQGPSAEINYLITDERREHRQFNLALFLVKAACSPTYKRNPYKGQFSMVKWNEVERRYNKTIGMSGPVIALGLVLFLLVLWLLILFCWKKIRQAELKEQRQLRLFIASVDRQMDEQQQEVVF